MAKKINRLTALAVTRATKPSLYADGDGLYLQVSPTLTKSWLFRFTLNGRARQMGLGPVNAVSLAEARDKATQCRKLLDKGIDPIDARDLERLRQRAEAARVMTFKACAEAYIEAHRAGWRNAKHASQWENTLEAYVYPAFGDLPVQLVDTALVMKVLKPIWATKTETATRVRGRIEAILDWAKAGGYRDGENPARWRGHLQHQLPPPTKVRKVRHHPALPYDQAGAFMAALRQQNGLAAKGLEFNILTATRTEEVIGARWEEFDLTKKVWTIPGERMKGGREYRVPLSTAAMAVLEAMQKVRRSEFVFPGFKDHKPLSNMAFLQLLKRMGFGHITAHGFRSTFRDWASERTAYPNEVAEMAIAHTIKDKAEAAYRRGDLFEKRSRMMEDWAAFCAIVPPAEGENVVPLQRKA